MDGIEYIAQQFNEEFKFDKLLMPADVTNFTDIGAFFQYLGNPSESWFLWIFLAVNAIIILVFLVASLVALLTFLVGTLSIIFGLVIFLLFLGIGVLLTTVSRVLELADRAANGTVGAIGLLVTLSAFVLSHR